jgi:hypothetical protein
MAAVETIENQMTENITALPEPPLFRGDTSISTVSGRTIPAAPTPLEIYQNALAQGIDPDKLAKLLEIQQAVRADEAAEAFAESLAKFQAKCPQITKRRKINLGGGEGPMYASFDDIMVVISPILAECGLCVTFSSELTDAGMNRTTCFVRHGRHVESSTVTLPVPSQMRVNDTQKMGACLKYCQRYALCAALNLTVTDEDTDAQGLVETISEEQLATIKELIESTGADLKRFCKWAAIDHLKEMSQDFYPAAINQLKRKANASR